MTEFPSGIITAVVTPMDRHLDVHHEQLVSHCRWLLNSGSDGILLLGTTGEGNSLSVRERMQALESVVAAGIPVERMMVGTGCCAATDTIALTEHAIQLGIYNVLVLPPFYYKQVSDDGLFDFFSLLIERVARAELRMYFYHIPQITGIQLSVQLMSRLRSAFPQQVTGIKDSGGDWSRIQGLIHDMPGFRVYAGTESFLLPTLQAGGVGSISATANATVSAAAHVMRSFRGGRTDENDQKYLSALRSVFDGLPLVSAMKGMLRMQSEAPDWDYLRPPNERLDSATLANLWTQYQAAATRLEERDS